MDDCYSRIFGNAIKGILSASLDLLFPQRCAGCGQLGTIWCLKCDRELIRIENSVYLYPDISLYKSHKRHIFKSNNLSCLARSYARYAGPLVPAVLQLKYRQNRRLAAVMAGWLAQIVDYEKWRADVIIPVPLSQERLRRRGYNQIGLIARALAAEVQIPVELKALERIRDTGSQVGLDPEIRWINVWRAFRAESDPVRGKAILLLDDVMTTGATLLACCKALKEAGAGQVIGLTVAQA